MSKINPVMKHAKPVLTAEQIAIEEFMDSIPEAIVVEGGTLVDNTVTEILAQPEVELDPIIDSEIAAGNLDELATDVDVITAAPALESFKRIFTHMTQMSGHPASFSMEEFKPTKGGVRKFAKAIRSHASLIRSCASIGLEDYVDKVDESVGTALSNLKQVMGSLAKLQSDLHIPDGNVEINHKAVWDLFHINDELIDLREFSSMEIDGVKQLADIVSKGKDVVVKAASSGAIEGSALQGSDFIQLMQNLDVTIKNGRANFDHQPVPKPDKSWSAGDWFWIFVFNWVGLVYRAIKGGSGEEKTKKDQSIKAIHKSIDEMKKLGPIIDRIDKDVDAIVKAIKASKGDQDALKKFASPVLEVAAKTTNHVSAVAHGMMRIFKQFG